MSPKKRPRQPLDCYVRVSRVNDREGDSFISPEDQEKRCRAQAEAKGYEVGQVFVDLDESGGKASRPAFDRALARIESRESGGLVVAKLDRFGRNVKNILEGVQWIEERGAAFVCIEPEIDTSTPTGRFVLTIFAALAELELDRLKAGWKTSQDRALARGVKPGVPPAGYSKSADGRLVKKEPDASLIGNAIRLRSRGGTWSAVARALEGVGTSRRVGGRWTNSGARNLVRSEIYKGVLGYYSDGSPCVVPELAVVPPSVWEKARPVVSTGTRDRESVSVLSGLLTCGGCGRKLTHSSTTRNGKKYTYWQCKTGAQFCDAPASVKDEVAYMLVRGYLLGGEEPELGGAYLPGLILAARAGRETDPVREAELENARDEASAELAAFLAVARASDPGFEDAVSERRAALEAAEAALAEERGSSLEHRTPEQIRALFDAGSSDEQRAALRYFLEKVVVDRGKASAGKRLHFYTREEPWKEEAYRGPGSALDGHAL